MLASPLCLLALLASAGCVGCTLVVVTTPLPRVQTLGAQNPHCLVACSTSTVAGEAASAPAAAGGEPAASAPD
jgi:hypothetical protein